jgi:hypothetical protein
MNKRARELANQEKQANKREKRQTRSGDSEHLPASEVSALMEEYARLSEKYSSDEISGTEYASERHRIFVELGIDTDS